MFKSKIHRATVTEADLDYEGSVAIDQDLLDAANILPNEEVHIWNVTRGTRLTTYAISGERGSGIICVNGAAAHHNRPGDKVIIATYAWIPEALCQTHEPAIVLVDEKNQAFKTGHREKERTVSLNV